MTPEEFKNEMLKIYPANDVYDPERAHIDADDLIIKVLTELGYDEGARIFDKKEKWYA